jgi:hypothetical protein
MLTYYKYKVDKGMMELTDVPEPYQSMLREKYEEEKTEAL